VASCGVDQSFSVRVLRGRVPLSAGTGFGKGRLLLSSGEADDTWSGFEDIAGEFDDILMGVIDL
jgi:hypothetical protein